MFETRNRLKRVPTSLRELCGMVALMLCVAVFGLAAPSPRSEATKGLVAHVALAQGPAPRALPRPHVAPRARVKPRPHVASLSNELLAFTPTPTPTQGYVVRLIHSDFPHAAWRDAEIVAWCESKFRPADIGFDSNGTHDRGVFQLNDGGTEQYLLTMLGHNPNDLGLALNPVVNVRLAALLYHRDGWSPWSCASDIPA